MNSSKSIEESNTTKEKMEYNSKHQLSKSEEKHIKRIEKISEELKEREKSAKKLNRSGEFGTKSNPKILQDWKPNVVHDNNKNKLILVFKGKLKK